jgi:hypothetical protein
MSREVIRKAFVFALLCFVLAVLPGWSAEQELRVVSMDAPEQIIVGNSLTTQITLYNRGAAAIEHFALRVRLFKDLRLDAVASQVREFTTVAPGATVVKEIQLLVPAVLNGGRYVLKADLSPYWTDPGNTVERDIVLGRFSDSTIGQPDLATANVELPSSIEAGRTLSAGILIDNKGTAEAGFFTLRASLVENQARATILTTNQRQVEGMPAGARRQRREIALPIPDTLPAGEYVLNIDLNPDHHIQELSFGNNTTPWRLNVIRPIPKAELPAIQPGRSHAGETRSRATSPGGNEAPRIDFRFAHFSVNPLSCLANGTVHARLEITNTGNAESPSPGFRILLSRTRNMASPVVLHEGAVPRTMPRGFTFGWPALALSIPAGTAPGPYFVAVEIDPANAISEENERNNISEPISLEVRR